MTTTELADGKTTRPRADSLCCQWHEETDGTRYLIPGCMARINDPDLDECDCPSLERQLAKVLEELAKLRRHKAGLQQWHDAVVRAVYDHRDGIAIMAAAARAADRPAGATGRA
jgi:hypothetical protein